MRALRTWSIRQFVTTELSINSMSSTVGNSLLGFCNIKEKYSLSNYFKKGDKYTTAKNKTSSIISFAFFPDSTHNRIMYMYPTDSDFTACKTLL